MDTTKLLSRYPDEPFIDHELYDTDGFASLMEQEPSNLSAARIKSASVTAPLDNPTLKLIYSMCSSPVLNKEQEVHLFQQLNFFRRAASRLRSQIASGTADKCTIKNFINTHSKITKAKNTILECNVRLAVNFIKKRPYLFGDFLARVSDAILIMYRAIDRYDWGRGFKFSTYASWALLRGLGREMIPDMPEHLVARSMRNEFKLFGEAPHLIDSLTCDMKSRNDEEESERNKHEVLDDILEKINQRESLVIRMRHGINMPKKTLEEVGNCLGVSKERVRQIQNKGMKNLRAIVASDYSHLCAKETNELRNNSCSIDFRS